MFRKQEDQSKIETFRQHTIQYKPESLKTPNQREKENQRTSSYTHVPTFWSLPCALVLLLYGMDGVHGHLLGTWGFLESPQVEGFWCIVRSCRSSIINSSSSCEVPDTTWRAHTPSLVEDVGPTFHRRDDRARILNSDAHGLQA